jgi:tight adherence protein B
MNATTLSLLFLGSFILLIGLAGAALLLDSGNRQRQRVGNRITRVGPTTQTGPAAPSLRLAAKPTGVLGGIAGLIGCDHARSHHYPMKWWLVPLLALVPGRVAVWLTIALVGPLAWLALPVVWYMACRTVYGAWDGKQRGLLLQQFPDALGMIVRTVRVGVPVLEGIRMVSREAAEPTCAEFRQLLEEISIGVPVDIALRAMAERTGIAEYRFFATAVALQMQTGGGLSDALEILADVVRRRLALRDRGKALTSEARASAWVLGIMPFVVALIMSFASPGYLDVLFTTETGNKLLGIGILSLSIGVAVMRMMIRRTLT